jgi:hypothetical protein
VAFDPRLPQFRRFKAGEAIRIVFTLEQSASGQSFRVAVAATEDATRPGQTPLVAYTGAPGLTLDDTGLVVTVDLSAADSGVTIGAGRRHLTLWRTDAGHEARLGWVILDL